MTKTRGKPFAKGRSGNPAGRPKGAKSKPKETTIEQEVEALQSRAIDHVIADRIGSARSAFTKMLALSVPHLTPDECRQEAEGLIEIVKADVAKDRRIGAVRTLYDDEAEEGSGAFFEHVGLPGDVTWERFRAHYAVGEDDVDADRAFGDFETYPPIVARVAELRAEMQARA